MRKSFFKYNALILALSVLIGPNLLAQNESARGMDIHFRGPVSAIAKNPEGNAVELTIQVNQSQVQVQLSEWTQLTRPQNCQPDAHDLQLGDLVVVDGFFTASGKIVADRVQLDNRDAETSPLRLAGIVSTLEDDLLSLDIGVENVEALVAIDINTEITGYLLPDTLVEVEGRFEPGTALVHASKIVVDENNNGNVHDELEDPESDPDSVELRGTITELSRLGDGSVDQITVGETIVVLDASTLVRFDDGPPASSSELQIGQMVELEGTAQSDGSLLASEIEIELLDDAEGDDDDDGDSDGDSDGDEGQADDGDDDDDDSPEEEDDDNDGDGENTNADQSSGTEGGAEDTGSEDDGEDDDAGETDDGEDDSEADDPEGDDEEDDNDGDGDDDDDDDDGEDDGDEVELEGSITDLNRLADNTVDRITVSGTTVQILPETAVELADGTQTTSSSLEIGQLVEVEGAQQPDNSIVASEVEIK